MKATEIQEITNRLISLVNDAEYVEMPDPFQSYWRGFSDAVELALKAVGGFVGAHADEIVNDIRKPDERYITNSGYEALQRKQAKEMLDFVGGK